MSAGAVVASAPGKVILFGEHGVNRDQPALAVAVGLRARCRVAPRSDDLIRFRSGEQRERCWLAEVAAVREEIDALRAAGDLDGLRDRTRGDFFAPARYVLGHALEGRAPLGLEIAWASDLPVGSGLGSGAAASAAMVRAALAAHGATAPPSEIARLAWQGDVVAHGGVASGLDSGACALGGLTRYTLADGPVALPLAGPLPLVIGDTRVRADTTDVNTRVRRWLAAHPARAHLFAEMGMLAAQAQAALDAGDLPTVGHLMNLNQLLLEKLGVSSPEIERLVEAALAAGALGAKLSGSGGGGIVVALTEPGEQAAVAAAIDAAGGRSIVVEAGVEGVREEVPSAGC